MQLTPLPTLQNVNAGSTATLEIPVGGPNYDKIIFDLSASTGLTMAQIKNIQIQANGSTWRNYPSGLDVLAENAFYKRGSTDLHEQTLTIFFTSPEYENASRADRRITSLGTADLRSLTIRFDIDSGASAPSIAAYALRSEPGLPAGVVRKVVRFDASSAAAGILELPSIPRSAPIVAIDMVPSTGSITDVEVIVDSVKIVDSSVAILEEEQKHGPYNRVPQSGRVRIDFCHRGDLNDVLNVQSSNDFRVRAKTSAATSVVMLVEYLDTIGNL